MPSAIVYDRDAGLSQGISQAGSAFAQAISTNAQREREERLKQEDRERKSTQAKEYGTILQSTLGQLGENPSSMDFVRAYSDAINQGLPIEMAQNMSSLQKALREPTKSAGLGIDQEDELVTLLTSFGVDDDQARREAQLYGKLTTGGKTQYANRFFDRLERGDLSMGQRGPQGEPQDFKNLGGEIVEQTDMISTDRAGDISSVEEEKEVFEWPKLDSFQGMSRKEQADMQKFNLSNNSKDYQETIGKVRGFDDEMMRLSQMETLNNSGKLPTGLQNLNINWSTGDIRFPKLANEETQAFVKMVNDFTTKAKDTYGARVTNFELGTFMRRLPTLANTEEGRRLILAQMQQVAALNKLYYDSRKAVYDKYKLKNLDTQQVETIAEQLRDKDEEVVRKAYKDSLQTQQVYEARQAAPEGKMPARSPDGKIVYIWTDQLDKAKNKGYEPL